ncbi:hypothetical protein D6D10_08943 [Aureobasidium pullulans]|uniref:Cysteine-rich transmembrane CYSTM domain-containing protein n=2 Tax=Aureobasidium pullulans TaxID=5580 RepID=A0A4V4J5R7_AURPU|nr:hypothetical protein D6D10_08943 [Aureobasidium pullulans]
MEMVNRINMSNYYPQQPQQAYYGPPQGQYGPPQGQYGGPPQGQYYPPQQQMGYQQGPPPMQQAPQKKDRGCLMSW